MQMHLGALSVFGDKGYFHSGTERRGRLLKGIHILGLGRWRKAGMLPVSLFSGAIRS